MKKPDITVTGAIGTNIVSASIPQKNVEGDLVKKHKSSIFIYKKPNDPKNYEVINWLGGAIQFSGKVKKIE
jgi:hypothetical protein